LGAEPPKWSLAEGTRYIEFDGQSYEIAPTARKVVTVLFHPCRKLWVLDHSPKSTWPPILGHFTLKSV
jgi:hypothetical protein